MALFGKLGDQVILRENLNNLSSMNNNQNGFYGQGPINNMNQNFPNNSNNNNSNNAKFDFTQCIRIKYHNPASIDINSSSSAIRDNFVQQLNNIKCPDLSNLQRILEGCDSMRPEITSFLALDTKLDDILAKKKSETVTTNISTSHLPSSHLPQKTQNQPQNTYTSNFPQGNAWSGSVNMNNMNPGANSNVYQSVFPQQQFPQQQASKGYNEYDIGRFVRKFKCAREMAIGYLEAFQNFDEAEQQFIQNTGWKG